MTNIPVPQSPIDSRQVVRGVDAAGNLMFSQVGVEEITYKGRFGAIAISGTENDISVGQHLFVIDDPDGNFRVGDDVLVTCLDDPQAFMWAEIINKGSGPTLLTVHVEDISQAGNITSSNWELQVVARPKFGITKDTSLSSVDPTAAGPFTLTVTSGKFFPVGGKLLMIPLADRQKALVGLVKAYSGTSLVVEKNSTNATVSQSYTSWAIALLDAPQNAIPFYSINGLLITPNAADAINDIDISPGSVRDSEDEVDLVLTSGLTKRFDAAWAAGTNQGIYTQSANLAGTVSSAGTNVTGTGTAFTTDFAAGQADYVDQYTVWKGEAPAVPASIITTSDPVTRQITPSTATAATTDSALSASADTYKRGGAPNSLGTASAYAVCIARKDSDGSTDIFATALAGNGAPDLPSGYTRFRIIARVDKAASTQTTVTQPLRGNSARNIRIDAGLVQFIASEDVQAALEAIENYVANSTSGGVNSVVKVSGGILVSTGVTIDASDNLTANNILSGTYTPTLNNTTNIDGSTAAACQYYRVGDVVTVSGNFLVDPTAGAGTQTELRMTLPIASTFTVEAQLGGTAASKNVAGQAVAITGSTANRACFHWAAEHTNNQRYSFSFTYRIV